jgi:[ribosomal protein S18]-alanine N-acetyltransferase
MSAVLRPQASDWLHRPMVPADLDAVMAVELGAYSYPWSRGNFQDSLAAGYLSELRLAADGQLLAYWVAMPGADELHLLNLTVAAPWQRRGHGADLLQRLVRRAEGRGDQTLWLEVRQSNAGARALYRAAGFAEVGLRRAYYPALGGREDAVVMRLGLPHAKPSPEGRDALD